MMESVVLVDDQNKVLGTAPKEGFHNTNTPLHRGFSLFVFNKNHELLLTRRALTKKTFPGIWTNTVCGHPALNEANTDAAVRRLRDELDMTAERVEEVSPYRYKVNDANGVVENEICPILIAYSEMNPHPHRAEVDSWKWIKWQDFLNEIINYPDRYSPWCREEALMLDNSGVLNRKVW